MSKTSTNLAWTITHSYTSGKSISLSFAEYKMDTICHASSQTVACFVFNRYNTIIFIKSLPFGQEAWADVTRDIKPCAHRSLCSLITDKDVLAQDAAFYM